MASNYQNDLRLSRDELADLLRERERIEIEVARQRRKVAALAELCDEGTGDEPANSIAMRDGLGLGGLTAACRTAFRASRKERMTIAEIQKVLKELGFPLAKYKAPAASITTTVNRMVEAKEVEIEKHPRGGSKYRWLGPPDYQVKIRGFRIELGEIESAMRGHELVEDAVVVVREVESGYKRLVAYVVPQHSSSSESRSQPESLSSPIRVEELRNYLKGSLPEYMIPTAFVFMERLPLGPNGKLDRKALPEPTFLNTSDV